MGVIFGVGMLLVLVALATAGKAQAASAAPESLVLPQRFKYEWWREGETFSGSGGSNEVAAMAEMATEIKKQFESGKLRYAAILIDGKLATWRGDPGPGTPHMFRPR